MPITLREVTAANREAVLGLRVASAQERFVGTVQAALAEAIQYPQANPWYRAVYSAESPVGFVMVSWRVEPQPPGILGPWYLWKLLIDEHHQGHGYGAATVREVTELIHAEGAAELLTSYVPDEDGPAGFYRRLGFVPTGELDPNGEVIVRLTLPHERSRAQAQPR